MRGIGSGRVIDQVKAYRPGHRVRADDVRALYGVMKAEKANKAVVTTTFDFAPCILKDPVLMEKIPNEIELINGENLLRRLQELAKGKAG
jgi:restriction system protein